MRPPMQVPQVQQAQMPQAVPQGMPQTMPHTGMSQTTAPMEGTWAPWQILLWNSWTAWQCNAMPCSGAPNGGGAPEPQPAPQQLLPQDTTWQQGEPQWQEQQPTQTWQRGNRNRCGDHKRHFSALSGWMALLLLMVLSSVLFPNHLILRLCARIAWSWEASP